MWKNNFLLIKKGLSKNLLFVSVAVIDQGIFKGEERLGDLKKLPRNP